MGTARLGTAASGLYRELSSSESLGSFSGAAGLLAALDTFPAFLEPKAARVPPSRRKALLKCAEEGAHGSSDVGLVRVDSGVMYADRTRRMSSTPAIKPGRFASYRNLLMDCGEFELSMVSSLEATSVQGPDNGPEKALDGLSTTRWAAALGKSAGSSITIHLRNTCMLSEFRFRQATPESGGHPGEWAAVVVLAFSDDSQKEFVVNATEEHGAEEQKFVFAPTAAEWVRVMISVSAGNRGAAITDVKLFGYDACNENLLVRQGEKIESALTAAMAGNAHANIWIAAGTYFESIQIMCPVTLVSLSSQPSIICSLDPVRPAVTCAVPGIYLHGLVLLQAGESLSTAGDTFTYDRFAPGLHGAHWKHEEIVTDDFGTYTAHASKPQDLGSGMGVWDRVKTKKTQDQGADERHRKLAKEFPSVLSDVVRYEEILATFEEEGADHIAELGQHSSELKAHKKKLKSAATESQTRVSADRRVFKEWLRKAGVPDSLAQVNKKAASQKAAPYLIYVGKILGR